MSENLMNMFGGVPFEFSKFEIPIGRCLLKREIGIARLESLTPAVLAVAVIVVGGTASPVRLSKSPPARNQTTALLTSFKL